VLRGVLLRLAGGKKAEAAQALLDVQVLRAELARLRQLEAAAKAYLTLSPAIGSDCCEEHRALERMRKLVSE
jgi:hypothetical protein